MRHDLHAINEQHIMFALKDLEAGINHPFGPPTGYELVHDGKRYPPKAVVGIAYRHATATGRMLSPDDFSGGEGSGQANSVLRQLGFTVQAISKPEPRPRGIRFWWVNQNQTFEAETTGGYLWSPKRNKNGVRNQFYENMREVSPGDLVFSFCDTRIKAIGVATSNCYDAPKPSEFGIIGPNWANAGWKVDVVFTAMPAAIRPKDHIDQIRPFLPEKYSPLQSDGDGLQSVYLAEISPAFASVLKQLLLDAGNSIPDHKATSIKTNPERRRAELVVHEEDEIESKIKASSEIGATEKQQLVKSRRGQGQFRENVQVIERGCRITGVTDPRFLRASHIKPWREATNSERLDGDNGLFLSPTVDYLFDRGFISFSENGDLLISPVSDLDCLRRLGIPVDQPFNTGAFSEKQKQYLSHHRQNVFLRSGQE